MVRRAANHLALVVAGALVLCLIPGVANATSPGIRGRVYRDLDRDGSRDPGEAGFRRVQILLFDGTGSFLDARYTDSLGRYAFSAVASGVYEVEIADPSWWKLREAWVPTTTGTLWPRTEVSVSGSALVDFGWRTIIRSTTLGQPISAYTGSNGLRVESYDDVVAAGDLYDAVMRGFVEDEASHTTIRFDYGSGSSTVASVLGVPGSYSGYQAVCYVNYDSWLDEGDVGLEHEYGHAWSLFNAYIVQQDPTFGSYLQARGLADDPRVNASYAWSATEMIAEDYRQLLGSVTARTSPQMNRDIPPAAEVQGLGAFLANVYTQPPV
jgi:hypothetical protein